MRKRFSPQFKAKVALSALKEDATIAQLSSKFGVHRVQIAKWKKQAIEQISSVFQGKNLKTDKEQEKLADELYRQIGQLKVENDWLKKKLSV
jgi:transposase-like protein